MFAKKLWIPAVLVLIGVAIGGTFWHQHTTNQQPTNQARQGIVEQTRALNLHFPLWTAEDVRKYMKLLRDGYVTRHFHQYPKCKAYAAVLADAERYTEWYIADLEYTRIRNEARAKWETELDALIQGEIVPRDYIERIQLWKSLTDAEKADLFAKYIAIKHDWWKRYKIASKRREEIEQQRRIFQPKHRH